MQDIAFVATEYQHDQSFQQVQYRFIGSPESGWLIEREAKPYLNLGRGYVAVRTQACGICATDLIRHKLPFALPQITGHEVIGIYNQQLVAIEINASHAARGISDANCVYCQNNLDSHCPQRMTLGIDRLPGGFSPWVLAPVNAIHVLPETFGEAAGVLIEPFAAALKAVTSSLPRAGDKVAVLGPRRLGMLLIAALHCYRQLHGIEFDIVAVLRQPRLQPVAEALGADAVIVLHPEKTDDLTQGFDIVFDTTGNVDGFKLAASMAKRQVHVKSTHGQQVIGLENITSMVINEQQMLGLNENNLAMVMRNGLHWPGKPRVYISPRLDIEFYRPAFNDSYVLDSEIPAQLADDFQAFDLALVSSVAEINQLTRPYTPQGQGTLRACGALLLAPKRFQNQPEEILKRISQDSLQLVTSRCGRFTEAIQILREQPDLIRKLQASLISDIKPLAELGEAFTLAARSDKGIKLVIDTREA